MIESKYTCPGCEIRFCSLPCSKRHKANTACTGQRSKTKFVSSKEFTSSTLANDYQFLDEVIHTSQKAKKTAREEPVPSHLLALQRHATKRNIFLSFMPEMMTRRQTNTTIFDSTKHQILWRVEWKFSDRDNIIKMVDESLPETITLRQAIAHKFKDVAIRHQLHRFVHEGLEGLSFYLKAEFTNKTEYYSLDPSKSLNSCLVNKPIIEFPTIFVVLPSDEHLFSIIKDGDEEAFFPLL